MKSVCALMIFLLRDSDGNSIMTRLGFGCSGVVSFYRQGHLCIELVPKSRRNIFSNEHDMHQRNGIIILLLVGLSTLGIHVAHGDSGQSHVVRKDQPRINRDISQ
jgi:hypothetical protein